MVNELILGRIALWCGCLMLPGMLSDASSWAMTTRHGIDTVTDAKVYNAVASLSGVVALIALAVALSSRPGLIVSLPNLLIAGAAVGLSVFVSRLGVWARAQGEIWAYSGGTIAGDLGPKWVADPADGPYLFTFLAALGMLAAVGLGMIWLRGARWPRPTPRTFSCPSVGGSDA